MKSILCALSCALLTACITSPDFIHIDALVPPPDGGVPRSREFVIRIDPFIDARSERSSVGTKVSLLSGPSPIQLDGDVSTVFYKVVEHSLARKGLAQDPDSPLILKGEIQTVCVGSLSGLSNGNLQARVGLQLTIFEKATRAQLWSRGYAGIAAGSDYQPVLAEAFQDLSSRIAQDDSILDLKAQYTKLVAGSPAGASPSAGGASPRTEGPAGRVDQVPSPLSPRARDCAVVVGIDDHVAQGSIRFAERDAIAFHQYAQEVLGISRQNAMLLIGSQVTEQALESELGPWIHERAVDGSRVYCYLAGRWATDPGSRTAYLIPSGGDPAALATSCCSLSRVCEQLEETEATEAVVFLEGLGSDLACTRRNTAAPESTSRPGTHLAVLSAASEGEIAGALDDQAHGMFTHFLLRGLKGEAAHDGHVTLAELHSFIQSGVQRAARRQDRDQTPELSWSVHDFRLY